MTINKEKVMYYEAGFKHFSSPACIQYSFTNRQICYHLGWVCFTLWTLLNLAHTPESIFTLSEKILRLTIFVSQRRTADGLVAFNTFETLLVPLLSSTKHLLSKVHCLSAPCTLTVSLTKFERCLPVFNICHSLCCWNQTQKECKYSTEKITTFKACILITPY